MGESNDGSSGLFIMVGVVLIIIAFVGVFTGEDSDEFCCGWVAENCTIIGIIGAILFVLGIFMAPTTQTAPINTQIPIEPNNHFSASSEDNESSHTQSRYSDNQFFMPSEDAEPDESSHIQSERSEYQYTPNEYSEPDRTKPAQSGYSSIQSNSFSVCKVCKRSIRNDCVLCPYCGAFVK